MEKTEINLVILSPSSEVNKLTFSSIPTATTIGKLRERISTSVVTHPAPGRQRLIYRGHALVDATKTLKDIFTQEIIDSSETLSLHLVLPPEATAQPGTSLTSSSIPNRDLQSLTPQHVHGSSDVGESPQNSTQNVSSQNPTRDLAGQVNMPPPAEPFQIQNGHVHGALPNGQFPPQLQQAFAQFQAGNQQLAAQLAAIGTNPGFQAMTPHQAQAQLFQQPALAQPSLQQIMAVHQREARAAGRQTSMGTVSQQSIQANPHPTSLQPGVPTVPGNTQGPAPTQSQTPGSTNIVVRENHGPNSDRWQMVIQSGHMNMNPPHNFENHTAGSSVVTGGPRHPSPTAQAGHPPQSPMLSAALVHLQSNLSTIEAAMAGGNPPPESVFEQAREMIGAIPDLPSEMHIAMNRRLNDLAHRASHLRENIHNHLSRVAQERVAAQRTTQGATSSAVYVLSSPSGPQALLVSPSGLYSTPWQFPALGSIAPQPLIHHYPHDATTSIPPASQIGNTGGQQPHADGDQAMQVQQDIPPPPPPQQIDAAQVAQAQQQQQVNQARDLLRIILPLGGHLWLLIRLFGFVYFFTAGAGWRRTILLGLVASLVFIAQTGTFRPIIHAIWDPIRRHAESLVPLAGNERVRPAPAGARAGNSANAPGTQPENRPPTPQEAAETLLQERERQDANFMRQTIRRVERAIALFVASLVPGVGERHIAAREAAEAARQAEAREMEEQAQREEEAARQQQEGGSSDEVGGEGNSNTAGEGITPPVQEEAVQPPLVDV